MIKTSANDILLYELCPHKWELTKSGKKEKKQAFAFYRFSSALHFAVNKFIFEMENIFQVFDIYWQRYKENYPLVYKDNERWASLGLLGHKLLEKFQKQFPEKNITPIIGEKRVKIITSEWEFTGQPDFMGYRDNVARYIAMDFKTTEEKIDEFWVHTSDQMTASAMLIANEVMAAGEIMNPPIIDLIICNFIKETEDIAWIESSRTKADIEAYKAKINHFKYLMYVNGYHPRRSLYAFNSPCSWCELKDICLDMTKVPEGLNEMLKTMEI